MKATGIIRKIDELGRIVIPKEIRKKMKIREGDPLEIYVSEYAEVILKKYAPMREIESLAKELVNAVSDISSFPCLVADKQKIIAVSGASKKDYLGKELNTNISSILENRVVWSTKSEAVIKILEEDVRSKYISEVIVPIIADGDILGCVIMFSLESRKIISETEIKLAQILATVLAKNVE